MPQDSLANPHGGAKTLPCLYREVGLAAVAVALNLQLDAFEPDVADAVRRGAAALFLAGYGPRPTNRPKARQATFKMRRPSNLQARRANAVIAAT